VQAGGARSGWARVGGLLRRVDMAVQSLVQSNPVTSAEHEYDQNREYLFKLKKAPSSTMFGSIRYSEGIN